MSVSLYRKYRPAKFEDVAGQDHITRTLVNAIKQGRISHAYLFAGPRGTGKTSTAKILAMALTASLARARPHTSLTAYALSAQPSGRAVPWTCWRWTRPPTAVLTRSGICGKWYVSPP